MSTIQSASTPPPSPPMARMAIVIARGGCGTVPVAAEESSGRVSAGSGTSAEDGREAAVDTSLQEADDCTPEACGQALESRRVRHESGPVERRAQDCGVGDLAAQTASHTAIDDRCDRIRAERVWVVLDGEGWAAGEANAGVVAGAGIGVDAEALSDHAAARLRELRQLGLDAALLVQLTFTLGDDDLGSPGGCGQRFPEHIAHPRHIIRASDRAHPFDADAADRVRDRQFGRS